MKKVLLILLCGFLFGCNNRPITVAEMFDGVDTVALINKSSKATFIGTIVAEDKDLPNDSVSIRIVGKNPESSEWLLVPDGNGKAKLYLITHQLLRTGTYKCFVVAEDQEGALSDTATQEVTYTNNSLDQLIKGRRK